MLAIPRSGYRLRFYPTALSASLWHRPDARSHEEALLRALLRPGDTVVDVGANIGTLTLCAAKLVGSHGSVYSFEAHPRTFRFLCGNLRINRVGNVTPFNLACGDGAAPTACLSSRRSDDQNSIALRNIGTLVRSAALDDVLASVARIALLKIDVEGYELFVLRGAARCLNRTQAVLFESWRSHFARYGYALADVRRLLEAQGFQLYSLACGALHALPAGYESRHCENLLAIRDLGWFQDRTGLEVD
jgi:FkbM family methyltransferase